MFKLSTISTQKNDLEDIQKLRNGFHVVNKDNGDKILKETNNGVLDDELGRSSGSVPNISSADYHDVVSDEKVSRIQKETNAKELSATAISIESKVGEIGIEGRHEIKLSGTIKLTMPNEKEKGSEIMEEYKGNNLDEGNGLKERREGRMNRKMKMNQMNRKMKMNQMNRKMKMNQMNRKMKMN